MDRLRELQMKQQLAGIEGAGDIAKLGYEASVEAAKIAREGKLTPQDYFNKATGLQEAYIKALGDGASAEDLAAIKAEIDHYMSLAGVSGTMGADVSGLPAGVTVTEK